MPVESAPVLADAWASAPPQRRPARPTIEPLARVDVAPRDLVEPVMRASRRRVASLRLTARAAEHRASTAEVALSGVDADGQAAAEQAELDAVRAAVDALRARQQDVLLAARTDAAELVERARADSRADVEAARQELDRSLAATTLAVASMAETRPAPPTVPSPEPSVADLPAADPGPVGPSPSTPVPTLPPPPAPAAPAPSYPPPAPAAASYQAVLIQNQDGTFQTAFLRTDVGLPIGVPPFGAAPFAGQGAMVAPWAVGTGAAGAVPAMVPATVAAPSAPTESAVRRLLHLDVVLPLVAVLIVLVVLLAWLG